MGKFSGRYKKGFREGYNNPKQNSNLDLNKVDSSDDYISGLVSGVLARQQDRASGDNSAIWSEDDLKKKLR